MGASVLLQPKNTAGQYRGLLARYFVSSLDGDVWYFAVLAIQGQSPTLMACELAIDSLQLQILA